MLDGSFYQYFESKEDLFYYLMKSHMETVDRKIEKICKQSKGDIFSIFITLYDYMIRQCQKHEDFGFFQKAFENMRSSQDAVFSIPMEKMPPSKLKEYYNLIDQSNLRVESEEDLQIILKILITITRKAILSSFKYPSKQKGREMFLKQIEYVKYGIVKEKKESEDPSC